MENWMIYAAWFPIGTVVGSVGTAIAKSRDDEWEDYFDDDDRE